MKRVLLLILRRLHPHPAPEAILRMEARLQLGRAGDGELADALADLRAKGYVEFSEEELSGDRVWTLTAKGEEAR